MKRMIASAWLLIYWRKGHGSFAAFKKKTYDDHQSIALCVLEKWLRENPEECTVGKLASTLGKIGSNSAAVNFRRKTEGLQRGEEIEFLLILLSHYHLGERTPPGKTLCVWAAGVYLLANINYKDASKSEKTSEWRHSLVARLLRLIFFRLRRRAGGFGTSARTKPVHVQLLTRSWKRVTGSSLELRSDLAR